MLRPSTLPDVVVLIFPGPLHRSHRRHLFFPASLPLSVSHPDTTVVLLPPLTALPSSPLANASIVLILLRRQPCHHPPACRRLLPFCGPPLLCRPHSAPPFSVVPPLLLSTLALRRPSMSSHTLYLLAQSLHVVLLHPLPSHLSITAATPSTPRVLPQPDLCCRLPFPVTVPPPPARSLYPRPPLLTRSTGTRLACNPPPTPPPPLSLLPSSDQQSPPDRHPRLSTAGYARTPPTSNERTSTVFENVVPACS